MVVFGFVVHIETVRRRGVVASYHGAIGPDGSACCGWGHLSLGTQHTTSEVAHKAAFEEKCTWVDPQLRP